MVASVVIFFLLIMVRFVMRKAELIVSMGLLCTERTCPPQPAVVHTKPILDTAAQNNAWKPASLWGFSTRVRTS